MYKYIKGPKHNRIGNMPGLKKLTTGTGIIFPDRKNPSDKIQIARIMFDVCFGLFARRSAKPKTACDTPK
jgi:hypothetical protein